MSKIRKEQYPIKVEIANYHKQFKQTLQSNIKILDFISDFVHYQKSDPIVPTLSYLTRKLFGEINEEITQSVILLDLLYTATLIHEDVSENYQQKQKLNPIKKLWQGKLSVLMGDFFLAKGLLDSVKEKSYPLLQIVSETVKQITEGKLYNNYYQRSLYISKEEYFELITKKYPTLFQTCTYIGAQLPHIHADELEKIKLFGYNLGIIKQINEEIRTFSSKKKKIVPVDLHLVLILHKANEEEKTKITSLLNQKNTKSNKEIRHMIYEKGIPAEVNQLKNYYTNLALEQLITFPETIFRKDLEKLISLV